MENKTNQILTNYEIGQIIQKVHFENESRKLKALMEQPLKAALKQFDGSCVLLTDGSLSKKVSSVLSEALKPYQRDTYKPMPLKVGYWASLQCCYVKASEYGGIIINMSFNFQTGDEKGNGSTPNAYHETALYLGTFETPASYSGPWAKAKEKTLRVLELKPAEEHTLFNLNEVIAQSEKTKTAKQEYETQKENIGLYSVRSLFN